MKLKILIFSIFISLFFSGTKVFASDINVECPKEPTLCTATGANPLFTTSDIFVPGKTITKTFNMKNTSPDSRVMAVRGMRTSPDGGPESVFTVSIVSGASVIWAGSLTDFYNLDRVELGTFSPNQNQNFDFNVTMDAAAGNSYKNRQSIFDLTLGFWGEVPSGGSGGTGGGGSGGSGGGGGPTCNDPAPNGAPTLLSATVTGPNQITLNWTKAADPVTYYLVTYGLASGLQQYGNPNVGGANTTSYTVSGLSGGTTYYFRVRAGNGCNGGPFSNELSATPGGPVLTTPPAGFLPGVLGESRDNIGEGTSSAKINDILGANNLDFSHKGFWQLASDWLKDLWWLLLLILLLLFLWWRRRRQKKDSTNS